MTVISAHRIARSVAAAALALVAAAGTAFAADRPVLRGDVVAQRDAVTLGDLVSDAPPAVAQIAVFRAPALGQSGTIQARRIVAAAESLGLAGIETGGRLQVTVTRAARQIGASEIEAAVKTALAARFGLEARSTGISFDAPPAVVVAPDVKEPLVASEVSYDSRSRRFAATVWVGASPTERRAQLRVNGTALDLVEVAVIGRAVERGDSVSAADVTIERRPRETVPPDALADGASFDGRVARRALGAGSLVRAGDLIRPELVARGDIVTVVYEMPGIALSLRAKASQAGALGDMIALVNAGSKKPLQGVVIGAGRVSVNTARTGRLASAAADLR